MLREFQTLHHLGVVADRTDGELLETFRTSQGPERELAFLILVRRYGPIVLHVCRSILADRHDAEDAAQATFLSLASQARTIRQTQSVGPWLHGVALRVSTRARRETNRRREMERKAARAVEIRDEAGGQREDFARDLHEAIDRLPEPYRLAILICDLEGLPHQLAARRLRVPVRTLQTRLYRGRSRLRSKLIRAGYSGASAGWITNLADSSRAAVPAAWRETTVEAASRLVESSWAAVAGIVSDQVVAWARSDVQVGIVSRTGVIAVTTALAVGLLAGSSLWLANREQEPPARIVTTVQTTSLRGHSAITMPMPAERDLQRILREVAKDAIRIAEEKPNPSSWSLAKIALAQSHVADEAGSSRTFDAATREAKGAGGKPADARNLWWIGQAQASVGMIDEARSTFQKAALAIPSKIDDLSKHRATIDTMKVIVKYQARVGDRSHARETLKRLEAIVEEIVKSSRNEKVDRFWVYRDLAAAQAGVADFDGAFATVERLRGLNSNSQQIGPVLASIAEGIEYLKPLEMQRFVRKLSEEISKLPDMTDTYFAWSDLAEAQARVGDIKAARESALKIGEGRSNVIYDMTDGQPYALFRVAIVQIDAGDLAGARETLRLGYETILKHPAMRFTSDRLSQIASGQIAAADLDGAFKSVEAMKAGERFELLGRIAGAQSLSGREDEARATMKKALEDARLRRPDGTEIAFDPSASRGTEVVLLQSMAGLSKEAIANAQGIKDPRSRRDGLARTVRGRAEAGDVEEAFRLASGLESADDRLASLEQLAEGVSDRLKLERGWKRSRVPQVQP